MNIPEKSILIFPHHLVKALVTGATGFIGSHLVELLLKNNYTVRCLLRHTSNPVWLNDLPVEKIYGDLFDGSALRTAVEGVDHVYHSAGATKAKTREEYFRANTTGTNNLIEALQKHNPTVKRFVYLSSQTAAGPSPTRAPITENAACHPITPYGESKRMGEIACEKVFSSIPVTILRPTIVYGPREKDMLEFFRSVNNGLIPLIGFREKYVGMIHGIDLVRGILMAAESDRTIGQTYFLTSNQPYGWSEIGEVARRVLNRRVFRVHIPVPLLYAVAGVQELVALFGKQPALISFDKARDGVQPYWTCDGSKARRDFGFEPQISLDDGVRDTIAWYKNAGWIS